MPTATACCPSSRHCAGWGPVWLDQQAIGGGENYGIAIADALKGATVFVLMASAASLASRNVKQEIALGWRYERPYLPLLLAPITIPDDLAYWLEAAQWIEVLDAPADHWLPSVLTVLRRMGIAAPPPLPDGAAPTSSFTLPQIPIPPTPLIGREQEVADIVSLLREPGVRLVTLTGPGGTGKTRLSLAVAAVFADTFANGVAFAPRAALTDPDLVLPAIAAALGVKPGAGESPTEAVQAAMRDRRLLLVLDNVEQVVAAAPEVANLLALCPGIILLVTSRAALHVRGEHEFPVPPLDLPDPHVLPAFDVLAGFEAIRLFVARAQLYLELARHYQEESASSGDILGECLATLRIVGEKHDVADALMVLGRVAVARGEFADAHAHLRDALAIAHELHDQPRIAQHIEIIAIVTARQEAVRRAARLWSAAASVRRGIGIELAGVHAREHDREIAMAQSRIDAAMWLAAWHEGAAMELDRAVAEAVARHAP
ncbi:MAG: TIR domain-containing protein [Chloroflexota bacterium]|nr:TIR domain-containing protein [Chloroflexota bacterium]